MSDRQEVDLRIALLNSILSCPHRELDKIKEVHKAVQDADPIFYASLAVWHKQNGEIRDHNEVFAGLLCVDKYLPNREIGLALFRNYNPFMKNKIRGFIKGKMIKVRHINKGLKVKTRNNKTVDKVTIERKSVGLKVSLPRSFKNEIYKYLKWIEADNNRFDDVVLSNFGAIKTMYASLRIEPSDRARNILFENNIPEDSKLVVLREILSTRNNARKAELIIKNKIPYTTAVSLISKMTPTILVALIDSMTPQQVINNIDSLRARGVYDNADLKAMVMDKLRKAEKKKNVAALKSKVAKKASCNLDNDISAQLDKVADENIKKNKSINADTALIIDKSASMEEAIEVGKNLAAMISGATTGNLYVVATDTMAREIKANSNTMTAWENAFEGIYANNGTSVGAGVDFLERKKYRVEQIVLITDEGENTRPLIGDAIESYKRVMSIGDLNIVLIPLKVSARYGNSQSWVNNFRTGLDRVAAGYARYEIKDDDKGYYALPGLIPLLSQKSKADLLYEIMDVKLPKREPFDKIFRTRKVRKKKVK